MNLKTLLLLCLLLCLLLLTACGDSQGSSSEQPSESGGESAETLDTPEKAMDFYITRCESGDTISAQEVAGQGVGLCEFPEDALSSEQSGDFEINGKTARVVWQWTQPEEASEKRLFTLGNGNKGWYIVEENPLSKIWFREETEEIDFEEQEQEDNELPSQITYVLQEGASGEKIVREKLTQTWSNGTGTTESEVISEEITTEVTPRILVIGKKPEADTELELTGLVEEYLASYQNGQYAELTKLAPTAADFDIQSLSQIAELEIISVEVRPPAEVRAIKPTSDDSGRGEWAERSARYGGKLVLEPFTIEAELPVIVKYKLFAMEFDYNEKLILRASPEDKVWTMPFWGVTGAAKVDAPSVTLKDNTITLDGVATMANSTLVALTSSDRAHQILATYEGNSEYAKCIQFPRCSVSFGNREQSDSFTLVIESGMLGFGSEEHEFNVELTRHAGVAR